MHRHRRQPTRLPRPWNSPGKNTEVGCQFLLPCMKVKSESEVTQSCPTLRDPMDCSPPGSSIMGFSRQEYWSGLPSPSPMPHSYFHSKSYTFIVTPQGPGTGDYGSLSTTASVSAFSVTQLCLTLCNPMDCSLPGSSVYGIFPARILESG